MQVFPVSIGIMICASETLNGTTLLILFFSVAFKQIVELKIFRFSNCFNYYRVASFESVLVDAIVSKKSILYHCLTRSNCARNIIQLDV